MKPRCLARTVTYGETVVDRTQAPWHVHAGRRLPVVSLAKRLSGAFAQSTGRWQAAAILSLAWSMASVAVAVEKPDVFEAQAVLWHNKTTADNEWPCHILVMNTGAKSVEISKSPIAYDVQAGRLSSIHYDCGDSSYPSGFVKLPPGEVVVWRISVPKAAERQNKPLRLFVSFEACVSGKKNVHSVECDAGSQARAAK
ncbi:MAG: hypothetical protein ABFC77_05010 [Thermoguttaceae bacterium]